MLNQTNNGHHVNPQLANPQNAFPYHASHIGFPPSLGPWQIGGTITGHFPQYRCFDTTPNALLAAIHQPAGVTSVPGFTQVLAPVQPNVGAGGTLAYWGNSGVQAIPAGFTGLGLQPLAVGNLENQQGAPGVGHVHPGSIPVDCTWQSESFVPLCCLGETSERFTVLCELPGCAEKDCGIVLSRGILTIKGQRKIPGFVEKSDFCTNEQVFGAFHRTIRITDAFDCIDTSKVTSKFLNGCLEIVLPKKSQAAASYVRVL